MKKLLALLALALVVTLPTFAGDLETGPIAPPPTPTPTPIEPQPVRGDLETGPTALWIDIILALYY